MYQPNRNEAQKLAEVIIWPTIKHENTHSGLVPLTEGGVGTASFEEVTGWAPEEDPSLHGADAGKAPTGRRDGIGETRSAPENTAKMIGNSPLFANPRR